MADFGSFLTSVALGAGQNIQYQQAQEARQAELNDLRSQTQARMQRSEFERKQAEQTSALTQFRRQVMANTQQNQTEAKNEVDQHQQAAARLSKQAGLLREGGDYEGAKEIEAQAEREMRMGKEALSEFQKSELGKRQAVSSAATALATDPSQDNYKALVQSMAAAGQDVASIPKMGTPEFDRFVRTQQMQGMDAGKRVEFLQKEKAQADELERRKQADKERHEDRQESMRDRAIAREQSLELRKAMLDLAKEKADKKGGTMSVQERRDINAVVGSAAEGARGLRIIAAMKPGQTAGAFAGLHQPGGIIEALSQVGARKVTPQSQQMYETASTGLGLEIGRVLTLGGGRGVNQSTINELQKVIQVGPGDTEFTAMFKLANAADIIRNRLSTLPDSPDEKVRKQQQEVEQTLKYIPLPEEVLNAAPPDAKASAGTLMKKFSTMGAALKDVKSKTEGGLTPEQESAISKYLK